MEELLEQEVVAQQEVTENEPVEKMAAFRALGLSEETISALEAKGFEKPSPIQEKTIPILLKGEVDVIGQAQTGTGKTAAFGLPMIEAIEAGSRSVKALVLAPTRELAIQVADEIDSLKGKRRLKVSAVYGGQSIDKQIGELRRGVDIVVGTPGRIIDHINRKTLKIDELDFFVLDEADEMLNMGFVEDIEQILESANEDKRMLFFSATMPRQILKLAGSFMREGHQTLAVEKKELTTHLVDQIYYELNRDAKFPALCRIIDLEPSFYGIVFCKTRNDVDELTQRLQENGYRAEGLHGDISQHQRERILGKFRKEVVKILIATDVAARGIDVNNLTHVVNHSLPQDPESYVHRIGRTGRAGNKGTAISFASRSDSRKLSTIKRLSRADIRKEEVPKVKDIIKAKKHRMIEEVRKISEDTEALEELMGMAKGILEDKEPELALASLIKFAFPKQFSKEQYKEISTPRGGGRDGDRGGRDDRRGGGRERRGGRDDRKSGGDRERRSERRPERGDRFGGRSERSSERGSRFGGRDREERGDRRSERRESGNPDNSRLFIALGAKDDLGKRELIDYINKETNVSTSVMDDVKVMDAFSFISVPHADADRIVEVFKKKGNGRSLVEKAKG
jgi:ATP-dependent RNA helicase DeaD